MKKSDYLALVKTICDADYRYYIENDPLISDYEYDKLLEQLFSIEKEHPEWICADSPTKRVSEKPLEGFSQATHDVPMLSLANTYSAEEIAQFMERVKKLTGKSEPFFSTELKMDGTAVSVRYEKGRYVRAVTRGNGTVGDDVTENLRTVSSLPMQLRGSFPALLEVRGEVYMTKASFSKLCKKNQEEGKKEPANPRNAAAGALKLLDAREVKERSLSIVFYAVAAGGEEIAYQSEIPSFFKRWGLPVLKEEYYGRFQTAEKIMDFAHAIEAKRKTLPFEIDGIVIKLDLLQDQQELGATGRSPRAACAYKFAPEQALSKILDITVQVGRTGILTPVAELIPTQLAGSTISRATLHNEDEIQRKEIRIGDTVVIEKGGDVIPKISHVVLEKRAADSSPWRMPDSCPSCGAPVIRLEGEVASRCSNKAANCIDQKICRIAFFASKGAMDIDHLGVKVVEQLVKTGLVAQLPDLYTLTKEQILQLEGFKELSANNLISSLAKSKQVTLGRFIHALGIPHVGSAIAEQLATTFGSIEALLQAGKEELEKLDGVGEKIAFAILAHFADAQYQEEVRRLLELGVTPVQPVKRSDHLFSGKAFVLTGSLANYTRQQAAKLIEERGGKIGSSVSKKTDYLLVGEEAGSKLADAEKLGITLLNEETFTSLL